MSSNCKVCRPGGRWISSYTIETLIFFTAMALLVGLAVLAVASL